METWAGVHRYTPRRGLLADGGGIPHYVMCDKAHPGDRLTVSMRQLGPQSEIAELINDIFLSKLLPFTDKKWYRKKF